MYTTLERILHGSNKTNWHLNKFILLLSAVIISVYGRTFDEPTVSNVMLTTAATVTATDSPNICFYATEDLCSLPRENESCNECIPHPTVPNSLVCCNVTDIEKSISCVPYPASADNSSDSYWINLHIRNATIDELDIPHKYWKRLDSLVITDGHINRITKEMPKFSSVQCINISNNHLVNINLRAFKDLVRLQMLDISKNNLSSMPSLNSIPTNLSLDIRGNDGMLCKSVQESLERGNLQFVEPNATYCLTNQTFNWFNSTDAIPLSQLIRMKQLQSECPSISGKGNCTCNAEVMTYEKQDGDIHLVPAFTVDCSGMGLTELPEKLPMNTRIFNVSNNNITSLKAFTDSSYDFLLRFYADDNQVASMLELEGTKFLENFEAFFLRRNKIKSIPIYLLSNTLDRSPEGRVLALEGNHLYCDCNSAKVLKFWLARQKHIENNDKMLCDNIKSKVADLSETKLCQSLHDWTDYIYYLITAEIFLLLALVMKVSYDYWIFKTAGYLPWPASKMPKLPCDWLCES
ncbi:protein halfway isoform X1 [Bradysia coprophila]|uniref:protein halfway isoform X1 n=1 Tax=Bradysia coprophila TaxID=38358 RepID=UPI00187DD657|nr:protein halfway isoform X1 [Bradysia coprophila]XP_037028172.1 protein halfway isoform X1 [Bradysia coprophila]